MAALVAILGNRRRRIIRRERVFRDHTQDLDALSDRELIARYRFNRAVIWEITNELKDDIILPSNRGGHVIPPHIQVLVTLRYLAKGNFLSETADVHGISRSSVCRIVPKVCSSLIEHYPIRYPTDAHKVLEMKTKFHDIANFPNVIGCIDGVLFPIQTPYEDEACYVCRKGFHALNVQAIVDADMRFINIVVKWPGATHDSFILTNSNISTYLNRRNNGWLLGDSGYPLKTWLMTPIIHPTTNSQRNYNNSHSRTRNIVERCFGVLKARFRCLDRSGGHMSYQPNKAALIICACFSLHNIATEKKLPVPDLDNVGPNDADNNIVMQQQCGRAQYLRNDIVLRF